MQGRLIGIFRDNIKLVLILIGLVAVIVVLVVTIAVGGFSTWGGNGGGGNEQGVDSSDIKDEATLEKEDEEYSREYDEIEAKVQELLNEQPVDSSAINGLYDEAIERAIERNRIEHAYSYVDARNEAYTSKGMYREALDAMSKVDFGVYSAPDRYRLYSDAMESAQALNDTAAKERFEKLREGVKDAYESDYRGVERTIENEEIE